MREIKFRAWMSDTKRPDEQVMLQVGDAYGTTHPLDCCNYARQGQSVTLMQYTGLKDKNGKEIYEGDILQKEQGETYSHLVEWSEYATGFQMAWIQDCITDGMDIVVVGNIHENPELLTLTDGEDDGN